MTTKANWEIYRNDNGQPLFVAVSRGAMNECMNLLEKNKLIGGVSYAPIDHSETHEYLKNVPFWENSRLAEPALNEPATTAKRRGRPASENKTTSAERMRSMRAKKEAEKLEAYNWHYNHLGMSNAEVTRSMANHAETNDWEAVKHAWLALGHREGWL